MQVEHTFLMSTHNTFKDAISATRCGFGDSQGQPRCQPAQALVVQTSDNGDKVIEQLTCNIGKSYARMIASFADSVAHAREVGENLIKLKEAVGHENWGSKLKELHDTFGIAETTANLYMRIAKRWDSIVTGFRSGRLCETSLRQVSQFLAKGALFSHRSTEWLTPPEIIEATLDCMKNGISLDPAAESSVDDKFNVPAATHYTKESDGLAETNNWAGSVFLNPPYGADEMLLWVERLQREHKAGNVDEGILLMPARTDTPCFTRLVELADSFLFVSGRLRFSGHSNSAPFPSLVAYVGGRRQSFERAFRKLGAILRPRDKS
jgi:hypothetical protein